MTGFFPFGRAPLALLVIAVLSGVLVLVTRSGQAAGRADLVFAVFSKEHRAAYEKIIPEFEAKHGVHVQIQLIDIRAMQSRLQAALLSGAEVPDVVELIEPSIGYFTRGPLADVGFVDLTERVAALGLKDKMVASRFGLWSSRGRIFALPHDIHPVGLLYHRELFAQLGIDPNALQTWDDVLRIGREVAARTTVDGVTKHFLLDLPDEGGAPLQVLLLQAGGGLFDAQGAVRFDDAIALRTVLWYVRATRGPGRIAVTCGLGQNLASAVADGLALSFLAPDWRTRQFEVDIPEVAGKMAVMPLPAWEPGGRRTSTWGGTGILITKASRKQDLAWELVRELYLRDDAYGARFAGSNILPPVRSAWTLPELTKPNPYWSNIPLGTFYAGLAPDVPPVYITAYEELARVKFSEAQVAIALRYQATGDNGIEEFARQELKRCADYVRTAMARDRFQEQVAR
jgi:arabinosaccharide transport system substrate-binding protein